MKRRKRRQALSTTCKHIPTPCTGGYECALCGKHLGWQKNPQASFGETAVTVLVIVGIIGGVSYVANKLLS